MPPNNKTNTTTPTPAPGSNDGKVIIANMNPDTIDADLLDKIVLKEWFWKMLMYPMKLNEQIHVEYTIGFRSLEVTIYPKDDNGVVLEVLHSIGFKDTEDTSENEHSTTWSVRW